MGRCNRALRTYARSQGLDIAFWSVDSDDWEGVSAEYIYTKVVHEARPGSVILFHLHAEATVAIQPRPVAGLRAKNLVLTSTDDPVTAESR